MISVPKLFRRRPSAILFEAEGQPAVENPSDELVRTIILGLMSSHMSFASITDEAGNYMQVAGSRPWCVLERRRINPSLHERAFQETRTAKYENGAKIRTGAGDIVLQHDEWFLLKDAAEAFVAFLHKGAMPAYVKWRSINHTFGAR